MCGIAGLLHWGRLADAPQRAERMAAALHHRGPDDRGLWSDADVALGFARLSIVDLAGGGQPMANEDGEVLVVYNGEIYNHRELRRELEAAGHRFQSDHSDTEVVVHGWEEWGEKLPQRLNGMFAFAVWDRRQRSLFLARDRFGVKPLYLARTAAGELIFGSEIRALVGSSLVSRQADPQGVLEYLSLQNNWHGRTPFVGIEMLPAGHWEKIGPDGRRRRTRYWQMTFPRGRHPQPSVAAGEYREILLDVVKRQMAADVPVMTYLSGGIDSSAITAAAHQLDRKVSAYSCIFDLTGVGEDRIVDERDFARDVARSLGVAHVELELPQTALISALDATIDALEYPRMGMAYVNYLIAGRVARDAKAVLSGMGGDELHGGYVGRYQLVPRMPVAMGGGWFARWRQSFTRPPEPATDPLEIYRRGLNFPLPAHELDEALTPEFASAAAGFNSLEVIDDAIAGCPSRDPWDTVAYIDATTYMHGLLVLEDKLSMAHGLEARVPLLDNALVDAVLDLGWELLCDGSTGKMVFRDAVKPWVSPTIYAKPKMGFGPPDASWYRGALKPWIEARLSRDRIAARGILKPDYVDRRLADHFAGRANNVAFIWSMLSLDSWCEQYGLFGGRLAAAEPAIGAAAQ